MNKISSFSYKTVRILWIFPTIVYFISSIINLLAIICLFWFVKTQVCKYILENVHLRKKFLTPPHDFEQNEKSKNHDKCNSVG